VGSRDWRVSPSRLRDLEDQSRKKLFLGWRKKRRGGSGERIKRRIDHFRKFSKLSNIEHFSVGRGQNVTSR
jgi:hypothetical protein